METATIALSILLCSGGRAVLLSQHALQTETDVLTLLLWFQSFFRNMSPKRSTHTFTHTYTLALKVQTHRRKH